MFERIKSFYPVWFIFFFGFDIYFMVKRHSIRLSFWITEDLNIRGSYLTNVNFANLGNQIKYIDTLKYYQQSLAQLVATIPPEN